MTIPVVGGLDPAVTQAVPELAQLIGRVLNPNAEFEHMTKALFLQKPELMQKFVDVEKANPGTLKAFGFSDAATNLFSRMEESIPALKARTIAPLVAEELQEPITARKVARAEATGMTAAEEAQEDFSVWFTKVGHKILKDNPDVFERVVRAKFGAGTKLEQTREEIELETLRNTPEELLRRPPMEVVRDVAAGKLRSSDLAGLLARPEGRPFAAAMALYQNEKDNELRALIAQNGRSQDDVLYRLQLNAAVNAHEASGRRGSVQGWYNQMWGKPDAGPVRPGDDAAITEALKDANFKASVERNTRLRNAIEPIYTNITKGGDNKLQELRVSQMNEIFKKEGNPWRAEWSTSRGFFGPLAGNKVIFKMTVGDQEIATDDISSVMSEVPPSSAVPYQRMQLNPLEQQHAVYLRNLTGAAKTARIKQIRENFPPETAEEIIRQGGGDR